MISTLRHMTSYERQDLILKALSERKFLGVADAVELTAASPATVRRDFIELAEKGVVRRHRGGHRHHAGGRHDSIRAAGGAVF